MGHQTPAAPGRRLGRGRGDSVRPAAGVRARAANRLGMGRSGESLSVFVVQRHFKRTRRGYDPDEVDRHLEVISQWLNGSRVSIALREGEEKLARLQREAEDAEERARSTVEGAEREAAATLEGAQLRAAAAPEAG